MYLNFFNLIVYCLLCIGLTTDANAKCCKRHASGIMPVAAKEEPIADPRVVANSLLHPQYKALIILDPGHGGKDLGAHSRKKPKYQEKYLNLTTAYMVKNFLQKMGFVVEMTRTDDQFISLDDRAEFANDRMPELFVSIHFNSAPNKEAEGIEVYYYRMHKPSSLSANSKKLGQAILKRVIKNTEAKSRGVRHGNLSVIRNTKMPGVLIEGGFLTNENEVVNIKDPMYLKRLAWGIAQGIKDYVSYMEQNVLVKKGRD